ncbi:DUF2339 domain-containing protein [Frigoriflavimonas asaccharolytica]|uniref:Putative membrane protein n=1 Tax=Frigoriflavimonas asaccharolytica TaxID=2735899 RepID=A0A8J8G8M2_9FLAO|nr:DUF2339 domain-containing protein [Frigoriflavimonas asaccharolytica]NRS91300.1 putative membrane protein [Frigoriflavimonas asaccharolytica]
MGNNLDKINQLQSQLDVLLERHEQYFQEIQQLQNEIYFIRNDEDLESAEFVENVPILAEIPDISEPKIVFGNEKVEQFTPSLPVSPIVENQKKPRTTSSLEKFVGENLINKIGILITVIGVAIGAKYSIENDLISPLTRIILGYVAGIALLGVGMKLKAKYLNYSAVLVSGAIAIMYFITYFAYAFYDLMPPTVAFILMFVFTAFTVLSALKYDKPIIAHIGLVGAYAIPFLLSDGSGNVKILFSYIAIINLGILVLSFKKDWKSLFYVAFALTWIIVLAWFIDSFKVDLHYELTWIFISIYFVQFYICFLAYKLIKKEKFEIVNIIFLLFNSFIFYGLGFALMTDLKNGEELLGLFTLLNAIIHFVVSAFIYKRKLADKNLFYLISGLVLVFITIAVPVQLDGNWVSLLWIGQATLLFWIGRTKNVPVYEKLSYILMILACISLWQDNNFFYENVSYQEESAFSTPIFNIMFLTNALFIGAFSLIYYLFTNKKYPSPFAEDGALRRLFLVGLPAIIIILSYFIFQSEIAMYMDQLFNKSLIVVKGSSYEDYSYFEFKNIWLTNYSLFFFSILGLLNIYRLKNPLLATVNRGFLLLFSVLFLTASLYAMSELRFDYLNPKNSPYFSASSFFILIRYISLAFFVFAAMVQFKYNRTDFAPYKFPKIFDCLLHISILWFASSELINWLDLAGNADVYKQGLSILWGVYALFLISLGIWKKKQYFRLGGIILFGITLIKLFLYDISEMGTISKTILFVALGVLLLIISFLYNKYKHLIFEEEKDENTMENPKNIEDEH